MTAPTRSLPGWRRSIRTSTPRTPARASNGRRAARVSAALGRPFLPWQHYAAEIALEIDPETGHYYYAVVVLIVARQAGKSVWTGGLSHDRCLTGRGRRVWYTAQTGRDAADWLRDEQLPTLAAVPALAGRYRPRMAQGSESIRWPALGSILRAFPPTRDALHGKQSDLVSIDEAWAFDLARGAELMQGIVPTQATRPGAQTFIVSAAADEASTYLHEWVARAHAAALAQLDGDPAAPRIAFIDFGVPDDLDATDPRIVAAHHPAFGELVDLAHLQAARETLGAAGFARAYGARHMIPADARPAVDLAAFAALADPTGPLPPPGAVALGFDTALDRSDAAVAAAWRDDDGIAHVAITDHAAGTAWLVPRLVELADRHAPPIVGYDRAGPAPDIADELARALDPITGPRRRTRAPQLVGLQAREYAAACVAFRARVEHGTMRHRDSGPLVAALAVAGTRDLGDAWAWARRSAADTSLAALTAATVALWCADHAPPPAAAPLVVVR
jgi:hypothetical protein